MEDKDKAIRELHERIEELARKQKSFQDEIQKIQNEIFQLDLSDRSTTKTVVDTTSPVKQPEPKPVVITPPIVQPKPVVVAAPKPVQPQRKKEKSQLEEFIGTNLLNKVGIAILVIGIGFGVKYSIDHDLIQPLTRIILGYVAGLILIGIALRIKKAHANFSAVLLSGGMAVLYFITFAAYDFYQLIPQAMTFILMVVFTAFTVFAAIQYNIEVIGIIGLAGAYAVPFLLSDGSGRVVILFSYMTIINGGILFLAFKKYWKLLYYIAFALTWLAFGAWWIDRFDAEEHLTLSLAFSTIFFITFYITFLSYKLIRKEPLSKADLAFMLLNSFVYYGFGYYSIEDISNGEEWLGLFTLFTAVIHFIACVIIHRQQSQFKDIFYFVAGMVLVFLTLAVPVQLEGNWVTLVWAMEAALMFWIGRSKSFPVYEKLSYPLMVMAAGSLLHDWDNFYIDYTYFSPDQVPHITIFANIQFVTTVMVGAALGVILFIANKKKYSSPFKDQSVNNVISYCLGVGIFVILFGGGYAEVQNFWNIRYAENAVRVRNEYGDINYDYDYDLLRFKIIWLMCYSAIFALIASVVQIRFIKNNYVMAASVLFNAFVITAFLTGGLLAASQLRGSYLNDQANAFFIRDFSGIQVRYLGIALTALLMFINYYYLKHEFFSKVMQQAERLLFHVACLIILSSELVQWLELSGVENSFKLALSILWGAYALFLIVLGLLKDQKFIRVGAITLFGVTLIKLFLYDMEDMSAIAKTIVMIILGILLLTASFLYNKYKRTAQNEAQ